MRQAGQRHRVFAHGTGGSEQIPIHKRRKGSGSNSNRGLAKELPTRQKQFSFFVRVHSIYDFRFTIDALISKSWPIANRQSVTLCLTLRLNLKSGSRRPCRRPIPPHPTSCR